MKKLNGIATLILEFSQLAAAQDKNDLLSEHPDARNNRQSAAMHDRAQVVQASKQHIERHHHRAALRRTI